MNIRDFRIAVMAAQQVIVLTEGTWSGLGSNNNWSTASNWAANRVPINTNNLIFAGTTRLTPVNNITSFVANNITFFDNAGAFSISGNQFTQLNSSYIRNDSSNIQTISNDIILSNGTAGGTINCNTAAIVLSGAISGANKLIKTGANQLTLSGANTYNGGTTVSAGLLKGTNTSIQGAVINNSAVEFNQSGNGVYAGAMSGTGSLSKTDVGTLTLSGTNTYSGNTEIYAGAINAASTSSLSSSSAIKVVAGAALDLNGYNNSIKGFVNITDTGTITNSSGSAKTLTVATAMGASSTAGTTAQLFTGNLAVQLYGGGSLDTILTNTNNTYSGGTILGNGSSSVLTRCLLPSGTIDIGTVSGGNITNGIFGTGTVTVGASATDKSQIYFQGATTFNNPLIINSAVGDNAFIGALRIESIGSTSTFPSSINANLADVIFSADGANTTVRTANVTGQISGNSGLRVYTVTSDSNLLVILGSATANTYSGNTQIYGIGTSQLKLAAANQIPNGAGKGGLDVTTGTFNMNGFSETVNGLSGAGTVDGMSATPTITVGDNNATSTFSGIIKNTAGSLSLVKIGAGTLTVTGANTYSGGTTVSAGLLKGTSLSIQGTVLNNSAVEFNQSGNGTYSGVMSGSGSLSKTDVGTVTLAGNNTYSGFTSTIDGKLVKTNGIATATFTAVPLTADFSSTPSIGQTYRFFPGSTVQRYYSPRSNAITFTDSGDVVTSTSHGLPNGTAVYFSSITSTTGISINTRYFVISSSTNTFQLSASIGGAALPLATSGSGVMALSTNIGSVGFVDSTNRVTLNTHGLTNGTAIYFSSIASTTGISINTVYYVINATTNDFQLAALSGGSVVDLVTDGTGVLCKNPMVLLTNAGGNIGSYSSNTSTLSVIGQLGATITGPQYAQSGRSVDINSAGDVIVVGGPGFGAGGGSYSKVFIYAWSGSAWVQRGSTFTGSAGEYLGTDVSLNADGTVVAMSTGTGDTVKVYAWNGTAWIQRGSTFTAASGETSLGSSISLNAAGDRIAIGAFTAQLGTGQPVGLVKIFSWSGSAWTQLGTTFAGVNTGSTGNYYVGTKVVLNDAGDRVLITSGGQSGGSTPDRGMGRVYSYSASTWTQVGNDILGTVNGEQIGQSASINAAGDVVALGTTTTNKAKVYSLVSSTWTQLGLDIVEANNNYFATSISLNAVGNRIAIGETLFPSPAIGRVRIYDYNNSVWSQFGSDANGTASYDYYGQAVALNSAGDKILIGAPGFTSYQPYGYVRAFQI